MTEVYQLCPWRAINCRGCANSSVAGNVRNVVALRIHFCSSGIEKLLQLPPGDVRTYLRLAKLHPRLVCQLTAPAGPSRLYLTVAKILVAVPPDQQLAIWLARDRGSHLSAAAARQAVKAQKLLSERRQRKK